MATITAEQNRSGGGGFLLFLVALIFVSILSAIVLNSHAFERHGDQASEVRNCISGGGTLESWLNPQTERLAHVCQIKTNRFGLQIEKAGREITSFIKNKMTKLSQVRSYLANQGYTVRVK